MKRVAMVALALSIAALSAAFFLGSCGIDLGGGAGGGPVGGAATTVDSALWGHWIRPDTGAAWYVAGDFVEVDGTRRTAAALTETSFSAAGKTLAKESANVLAASDGSFRLLRNGDTGSALSFFATPARAGRSSGGRALGLASLGGIKFTVTNLKNAANAAALTETAGVYASAAVLIPGDAYAVTAEGGASAGPAFVFVAKEGQRDEGIATKAETAYSFKAGYELKGAAIAGSGSQIALTISNAGSAPSPSAGAGFLLRAQGAANGSTLAFHYQYDGKPTEIPSIDPGNSASFDIPVDRGAIVGEDFEDSKLVLDISDGLGNTWTDYASVRFYRKAVTVKAIGSSGSPFALVCTSPEGISQRVASNLPDPGYQRAYLAIPQRTGGSGLVALVPTGSEPLDFKIAASPSAIADDATGLGGADAANAGEAGARELPENGSWISGRVQPGQMAFFKLAASAVTRRLPAPSFEPPPGSFSFSPELRLPCLEADGSAIAGAKIYYVEAARVPTEYDYLYQGGISIGSSKTIRAIAREDGLWLPSEASPAKIYAVDSASSAAPPISWTEHRCLGFPAYGAAVATAASGGSGSEIDRFHVLGGRSLRNFVDPEGQSRALAAVNRASALGYLYADATPYAESGSELPDRALAFAAAAVLSGRIYLLGGYSAGDSVATRAESYYAALESGMGAVGPWSRASDLPAPAAGLGAVAAAGRIYVAGGAAVDGLAAVASAAPAANGSIVAWRSEAAMTTKRAYFGMVAHTASQGDTSYLYALGGRPDASGPPLASIERAAIGMDGVLGPWSLIGSLPGDPNGAWGEGLAEFGCAVWPRGGTDYLAVIGGARNGALAPELWLAPFNADGALGAFIRGKDVLPARKGAGAAVVKGRLLAIGGMSGWASGSEYTWDDILLASP